MLFRLSHFITVVGLLLSGVSYIFHDNTIDGLAALGVPEFLRIELAALTLLAAVALLIPRTPNTVRESAYVGAGLFWLTAAIAHIANQDPAFYSVIGLFMLASSCCAHVVYQRR